jgi:hypothetical protein
MVNHLPRWNGRNNICFTRSKAGSMAAVTLISRAGWESGWMGTGWILLVSYFLL